MADHILFSPKLYSQPNNIVVIGGLEWWMEAETVCLEKGG